LESILSKDKVFLKPSRRTKSILCIQERTYPNNVYFVMECVFFWINAR
jgi:hypothetical protein